MAVDPMEDPSAIVVLVTGGSGFLATQLILQSLTAGYTVRTTVRNTSKEPVVRNGLQDAGVSADALARLSFFTADLAQEDGWAEAMKGCTYVQHLAGPSPGTMQAPDKDIPETTRDGVLRVMRAARDANVKRLVLTSSFAAIGYGQPPRKDAFTEKDWTVLDGKVPVATFQRMKTVVEKAAWEFVEKEGNGLELVVVNPGAVIGPVLSADLAAPVQAVHKLVDGTVPACPQLFYNFVDVCDLADLHLRAMLTQDAKGHRFIAINDNEPISFLELGKMIKKERPEMASKVPTKEIPNMVVRTIAKVNKEAREIIPLLGIARAASNSSAKQILGWQPRPLQKTLVETIDSLVAHKIV
ncbi:NAD(P)-binding protein [Thozetella sp. PMI_491]|nr:NAD(P)-binding protein [Thozetella sp. PMI_491]